jgi:putative FmdB family regulatory protein
MPLFEYRCDDCSRKFTLLVGMVAQPKTQECPKCKGTSLRKLVSRFRTLRSEDDILESVADPSGMGDPEDPKAMASWMRKVSREMGEDLGDDFDELVEEAVREEMEGPSEEGGTDSGPGSADDPL